MNPCPSRERLRMWLAGRLGDADGMAIEAHVEQCPEVCQPMLDSMSGFEDDMTEADHAVDCGAGAPPAEADGTPTPQTGSPGFPCPPGYEILCELGRGGMGVVFKARHRRMDRIVAIKVLPAAVTKDQGAVARFDREVKAAAKLRHPNIVADDDGPKGAEFESAGRSPGSALRVVRLRPSSPQ
jgi:hypothetical protein